MRYLIILAALLAAGCNQEGPPEPPMVQAPPPLPRVWFSPADDFQSCIMAPGGPARQIEELRGERPEVREHGGRHVSILVYRGDQNITWNFYLDKPQCENEMVNRERLLADKYR